MSRITRIVLLAVLTMLVVVPAANAVPSKKSDDYLARLWTTVLETPSAENPFGSGGPETHCIDLGGTVAPFGPNGADSCTVKSGTKIFIAATSVECSTFEGNGTTETQLRECAQSTAGSAPTVTVDGKAVPLADVETPLLDIVLPADNIFGLPAGTSGSSVAQGWVALLHPLTPGTHTITIDSTSTTITTTIIVQPGH